MTATLHVMPAVGVFAAPNTVAPKTIAGIKRLAKTIARSNGIQHVKALDLAAQIAGYRNYKHARTVLSGVPT